MVFLLDIVYDAAIGFYEPKVVITVLFSSVVSGNTLPINVSAFILSFGFVSTSC